MAKTVTRSTTQGIAANPKADTSLTTVNISSELLKNQPAIQQAFAKISNQYTTAASVNQTFLAAASALGANFNFRPNILDQYANYTYHIRWSITNDRVASTITNSTAFKNLQDKTVIAESGVTAGFNIIELEMKNLCSPGPKVQMALHTEFKMVVKEPYGLSLMDRIYAAGNLMGIQNYLTCPYFIEIWFTGYNEDGTVASSNLQNQIYRLFRVICTKLEAETTSAGTTYTITGMIDGAYGNTDNIAIIGSSTNIGPVTTVGSFFKQLETTLNAQQQKLSYDNAARIKYVFQVPNWMSNWKFGLEPTNSQRSSDIKKLGSDINSPTISISRGMDVNTVLNFVMSMSVDGQNFVKGTPSANQSSPPSGLGNIATNGLANVVAIHSQQKIIGWDLTTNDYIRQVTYTFTAYPTAKPLIDQKNVKDTLQATKQQARLASLAESHRYIKQYQYIYTGQNLDVIRFDIKFEWFWQTSIPSQLGENTYANTTAPPVVDQNSQGYKLQQEYLKAVAAKNAAQAQIASAKSVLDNTSGHSNAEITAANATTYAATKQLVAANKTLDSIPGGASNFQILWQGQSAGQQAVSSAASSLTLGGALSINTPQVANTIAQQLYFTALASSRKGLYLEDTTLNLIPPQPLPISFRPEKTPGNQTSTLGSDGPATKSSNSDSAANLPTSRSLVASVLNEVTSNQYFVNIELEIRGDPYWMGLGNVDEELMIGDGNKPVTRDPNMAWFYGGDVGFLLSFRTGESPNETTGIMQFDNTTFVFEGLYNATEITNTFRDGKFVQLIKAYRDPLTRPNANAADASSASAAAAQAATATPATATPSMAEAIMMAASNFGGM